MLTFRFVLCVPWPYRCSLDDVIKTDKKEKKKQLKKAEKKTAKAKATEAKKKTAAKTVKKAAATPAKKKGTRAALKATPAKKATKKDKAKVRSETYAFSNRRGSLTALPRFHRLPRRGPRRRGRRR